MKQIVDKLNKIAKKIDESVEIPQTDLIIDSLDAITKAYGGTPNDSNLIVDKLEDIYNNIGSGGGGFVNPLIHFNISFENDVTENIMWWEPGAVEPDPPTVFTFLIDSLNQLGGAPQVDVFFDSETPFEWDLTFIALYYHEGTSTWGLSVTASSDAQEIKSVTSSDCTVMFNAQTFACSIPDGQSEATINVVIGNKTIEDN